MCVIDFGSSSVAAEEYVFTLVTSLAVKVRGEKEEKGLCLIVFSQHGTK